MNSNGFGNPPSQRRLRHLKCIFIRNLVADPTSGPSLGAFYYTLHAPETAVDIDRISVLSPETAARSQNGITPNKQPFYPSTNSNNSLSSSTSTLPSLSASSSEIPAPPLSSSSSEIPQPNGHPTNSSSEPSENVPLQDGQSTNETETGNENENLETEDGKPQRTSPDLYRGSPTNTNEEGVNEDDILPPPFYTSEVVTNTCNPTWRHLDCSRFHLLDIVDVVHTTSDALAPVIQLEIELADLELIGTELRQIGYYVFPQNSVIFEMRDGLYVTRETRENMRPSRVADVKPAMAPDKRKAATCNQFAFVALIAKKRGLIQAQEKGRQMSDAIEAKIAEHEAYQDRLKQREALRLKIAQLKEECATAQKTLKTDTETLRATRAELLPRAKVLGKAQIELLAARQQLANQETKALEKHKDNLSALQRSYEFRRYLVSQIRTIYTIQQSVDGKSLSINGFRLPNSDFAGCDEEQIATALGYVSHILCLAANYLEVPLRYPMIPMCSRSMIIDEISQQTSPKFPLYSRGVDRTRFDYAVFLLNKNLEQLLNSQGLEIVSLRHTLPNVQILLSKER